MNDILLTNLSQTFEKFICELELSFEYISSEQREKLQSLTTVESFQQNPDLLHQLNSGLSQYSEEICKIQFAKTKISTNDYKFLKNIKLFDFFSFEMFLPENKNTKKSLVNYLYSFYIFSSASEENTEALEMISKIEKQLAEQEKNRDVGSSSGSQKSKKQLKQVTKNLRKNPNAMNEVNKLMSDLMGNKEIMSIANDVSKQFQEKNIDPSKIMSSLLSGNLNNPELKSIFENVSSTIEQKINDGSIDKNALESQTNSIMSQISKTNLGDILKKNT
jgi:hypothetical protein